MNQSLKKGRKFHFRYITALILALALVYSLLPTAAFAEAPTIDTDTVVVDKSIPAIKVAANKKKYLLVDMTNTPGKLSFSVSMTNTNCEVGLVCKYQGEVHYVRRYIITKTSFKDTLYLTRGKYYLYFDNESSAAITFKPKITIKAYKDSTKEPFGGTNNSVDKAASIKFKKTYYGIIGTSQPSYPIDNTDYYKFKMNYGTEISIKSKSTGAMKGEEFDIFNSAGALVAIGRVGKTLTVSLEKGTYYLKFGTDTGIPKSGAYAFKMTYGPDSSFTANDPTSQYGGSIRLDWSKVSGAKQYEVYRSIDYGKTWVLVATTTNTSFTQTGLYIQECYSYKVRGVSGSQKSNFSLTWRTPVSWWY